MIINTQLLKETFSAYLEKLLVKETEQAQFVSFAYPLLGEIKISSIIDNLNGDYFYWNKPKIKEEFLGIFPLFEINEFGTQRIEKTGSKINNLQTNFISNWSEYDIRNIPLVMGGIKFAPNQKSKTWAEFSDSDWFIPEVILLKEKSKFFFVFNFLVKDNNSAKIIEKLDYKINSTLKFIHDTNRFLKQAIIKKKYSQPVEKWYSIINTALNKISRGELKKTVLSREVRLVLNDNPSITKMLQKLSDNYPGCYIFAFKKNKSVFIGASPEKLVKISKKVLEIDALAGSVARGKTEAEDRELEEFLLHSEKNINEQTAVVTFIKDLLTKISADIKFTEKASIRKLPNIQHLWTPITAELQNGYMLFDVIKALHPTPAICGTPWNVARDNILKLEEHDRGLYSGNIGWFNFDGDGEFAVGIRSALVKENKIYAYAGCGIVKGSEPQSEFEESEIKLRPILSLFDDETSINNC